jgi:hypothetical protein
MSTTDVILEACAADDGRTGLREAILEASFWSIEVCRCKHLRGKHHDKQLSTSYSARGHGKCSVSVCPCLQFTWVAESPMDIEQR